MKYVFKRLAKKPSLAVLISSNSSTAVISLLIAFMSQLRSDYRIIVFLEGDGELDKRLYGLTHVVVRLHMRDTDNQVRGFISKYRPSFVISCEVSLVKLLVEFEYTHIPVLLVFVDDEFASPHDLDDVNKAIFEISGLIFVRRQTYDLVRLNYTHIAARKCFVWDQDANKSLEDAHYAASFAEIAQCTRRLHAQSQIDYAVIESSRLFEAGFYLKNAATPGSNSNALHEYLFLSKLTYPRDRPGVEDLFRKPSPGFHPLVYATENETYQGRAIEDPFAHYIRSGRPEGPWAHSVIVPGTDGASTSGPISIAIHAHFHYPDLLPDLLARLSLNRTAPDLFVTTTSVDRKEAIENILQRTGVEPFRVHVVDNIGRDLMPFIALLREDIFGAYDLVGHVHGKKSPHLRSCDGDAWRHFLWENLIGGRAPMLDQIARAFAADPELGLVFPDDTHIYGWDNNESFALEIVNRLGLSVPLPRHFNFPIGTMFWARPAALRRLTDLHLGPDEIPLEPLPIDGTMLHAIERMLPFLAKAAGFRYATTFVRGVPR